MRARHIAMLIVPLLGCGPTLVEEDDGPTVDPEVYAAGYCAQLCRQRLACGQISAVPNCEVECQETELDEVPDDPCWPERIEFQRCVVRKLDCSDIVELDPPTPAGSPCADWREDLDVCLDQD